jgi:hypothetical protein
MTDPLRPTLIAPSLRRLAARAGAAMALQEGRRRAQLAQADHVVIEGQATPAGGAGTGPEAYRTATGSAGQARGPAPEAGAEGDFRLVRNPVDLTDARLVERFLPDILGRALARSWVDGDFRERLTEDPKALLAEHEVYLPGSIWIETQTGSNGRPMIVVHERQPDGALRRLLYLQLVMLAGK